MFFLVFFSELQTELDTAKNAEKSQNSEVKILANHLSFHSNFKRKPGYFTIYETW